MPGKGKNTEDGPCTVSGRGGAVDTRRSTEVVTIATYRDGQAAEAELARVRTALGPGGRQMARLLLAEGRAVDVLTEMLLPGLVPNDGSPGVRAAMESRLTRALGHTFLQEVDRRLAGSAAGIAVLTDGDAGSDVRLSLADKADHLLGRTLRPPEQLLVRRRS